MSPRDRVPPSTSRQPQSARGAGEGSLAAGSLAAGSVADSADAGGGAIGGGKRNRMTVGVLKAYGGGGGVGGGGGQRRMRVLPSMPTSMPVLPSDGGGE